MLVVIEEGGSQAKDGRGAPLVIGPRPSLIISATDSTTPIGQSFWGRTGKALESRHGRRVVALGPGHDTGEHCPASSD